MFKKISVEIWPFMPDSLRPSISIPRISAQTWISFSEYSNNINKIPLDEYDWGWLLINELMKDLSTHYGEENIRVVVCFD